MKKDFEYCEEFYELLKSNSQPQEIHGIVCDVFEGGLVRLYRGMGISQGYYTKIVNSLKSLGCITVVRRGSRSSGSLVILHHAPQADEFVLLDREAVSDLTSGLEDGKLAHAVKRIVNDRLGGMDIVEAIDNLDKRVRALEQLTTGGSSGKTKAKK